MSEREGVAGGELHAEAVQMPEELPGRARAVGADQDMLPGQCPGVVVEALGQLGHGGVEDPDVVLSAVRSGVAWPQHAGKDLP